MKTNYCQRIFGGVGVVKQLIVAEMQKERIKLNLTPEKLDHLLKLGAEYPSIAELEDVPDLFHPHILDVINWAMFESDSGFEFHCSCLNVPIAQYLSLQENLDKALGEWHESGHVVHVTCWPADEQVRDEFVRNTIAAIYEGRSLHWPGGINTVTPIEWATIHVFRCIMEELK